MSIVQYKLSLSAVIGEISPAEDKLVSCFGGNDLSFDRLISYGYGRFTDVIIISGKDLRVINVVILLDKRQLYGEG